MMVTIFDGIENLTKQQLCHEIALFEQVTLANIAGVGAGRLKTGSIRLINRAAEYMKAPTMKDAGVLTLSARVALAETELIKKEIPKLRELLLQALREKLKELGVAEAGKMDAEQLSVQIAAQAAQAVEGVHGYLTPLRKMEAIADKNRKIYPDDFARSVLKKKLDRELLAHAVMVCVRAYDKKLSPALMSLPGFLPEKERASRLEEEAQIRDALKENGDFLNEYRKMENAVELSKDQVMTQKSILHSLKEREQALLTKTTLTSEEVKTVDQMLKEVREEAEGYRSKQSELEEEYYAKQVELESLKAQNESKYIGVDRFLERRKKETEESWQKAFPKLDFKEGVISGILRTFFYEELLDLEEAFMELSLAEHAGNLDETPEENALYRVCRFYMAGSKAAGRIAYHEKGDRILILQVQKSR